MSDAYQNFLAGKHIRVERHGIDVPEEKLCASLKDWQRVAVRYFLKLGRAGAFEDCGLGKTIQFLAWGEALLLYGGCLRGLVLTPAAVAQQTLAEARKFGIRTDVRVVRCQAECDSGINVTNYERLHLFDPSWFDFVVTDEGSIMKSFMGKTKQTLLRVFRDTRFKLSPTATPAPNDHLELGNQAEFLGVMRANEMLMRWFINDTMSAGDYRLKRHAEDDYWRWVAAWAVSVSKPSDLGPYSDAGYELPPLDLIEHVIGDAGFLSSGEKLSATEIHKAKRARCQAWAAQCGQIVSGVPGVPWVVWCDTNYEADELRAAMPDAVEVRGSQSLDEKEELLSAFTAGQIEKLITKPEIAGFGLNWQHCWNTTFPANYSYERFYQALRRFLRFGQVNKVNCHIVMDACEMACWDATREKAGKHELMKSKMTEHMKSFQQENLTGTLKLQAPTGLVRHAGDGWTLWHGDCVAATRGMDDDSIDFCIHSPPFSNLYIYSDSLADMGNAKNHDEFFRHYEFLIEELHRATVPGRLCAVHCKDLPLYKGRDGAAGLFDFPAKITGAFEKYGWVFQPHVTIWKDPVTEMQRTKNHGLLHRQLCKDSSASRQGMADYLLVFRKWTDAVDFPRPVTRGSCFARFNSYVGEEGPEAETRPIDDIAASGLEAPDKYSIQVWQRYASPVWFDIRQMRVLNYRLGRDDKDEKHICPLQLDVIERSIDLWTNPGDLVFDPFNGIGSSGYVALRMNRRYVGSELKESYVTQSLANFQLAINERSKELANPQRTLFGDESQPAGALAL